jgi:hypothetical protein
LRIDIPFAMSVHLPDQPAATLVPHGRPKSQAGPGLADATRVAAITQARHAHCANPEIHPIGGFRHA